MEKKRYKITLKPITAIHVGTGNELTLLDYKTVQTKQGNSCFMRFSSDSILQRIATTPELFNQFDIATQRNDMKAIRDFFHKNCVPKEDIQYLCHMTKGFAAVYENLLKKDPLDNAAIVHEMYRPKGMATPVIPGSSVKGAIRTAVLNGFVLDLQKSKYDELQDELKKESRKDRFDKKLTKELLKTSDAKKDPFRAVQISDFTFEARDSQIVGVLKSIGRRASPKQMADIYAEAIKGSLMDSSKESVGSVSINLDLSRQHDDGTTMPIYIQDIIDYCNDFYSNELDEEYDKFYKDVYEYVDLVDKLKQIVSDVSKKQNQFVLRLGRWSQVESMTLEGFRTPKTPNRKGKQMPSGTTRTVMDYNGEYLPMGWCVCTVEEVK